MLEEKTYTFKEVSTILHTKNKNATDKKLENYAIRYTSKGRGDKLTYTITEIPNKFKVFCVFDLGFAPQTDFSKLREFLFYLLNDPNDDFAWRPMEMMEEYLRIVGNGMSRQTISKYIERLKSLNYICSGEFIYYRVYKRYGVQKHEIVTKEEYSKAWKVYWNKRGQGYESSAAFSVMYNVFKGTPRKQRMLEENGIYKDDLNLLSELITESYITEIIG